MRPIDAVREAHDALRKTARAHRRAFAASPLSAFVTAMRAAMDEYRTFRREGVSRDDACRGLEAVLRDAWPHQASKFDDACQTVPTRAGGNGSAIRTFGAGAGAARCTRR